MESILTSIKKVIGIEPSYEHFDPDIIVYTNSVFSELEFIGVKCSPGFSINNSDLTWDDYIAPGALQNLIREYVPLKVKKVFDPTASSVISEAMDSTINKLEWQINVMAETWYKEDSSNE